MAFGAVKALVVSGGSCLLRVSGAQRRTLTSSCSEFSTFLIGSSSSAEGRSALAITCTDCLGKQWSLQSLEFRRYAAGKSTSAGDKKGFAQGRTRRGGATVATRGTPRSVSAAIAAATGDAAAAAVREEPKLEEEEEEEWKSRNQSKRDAKRAKQWGHEMASLAPAQLKQAVRWAGLSQDVYDAVMVVKNLGTLSRVRNGRRRQYNYIGGLLRNVDPDVMEPVLKATRDGDVEGIMFNSPVLPDPEDLHDKESWAEEDEEDDEDSPKLVAEDWVHGLINGISSVEEEVYSIYDVDYDRQELRKLVRSAQKSTVAESSATLEPTKEDGVDSPTTISAKETKSQEKLRQFLINIAKERAENQSFLL